MRNMERRFEQKRSEEKAEKEEANFSSAAGRAESVKNARGKLRDIWASATAAGVPLL